MVVLNSSSVPAETKDQLVDIATHRGIEILHSLFARLGSFANGVPARGFRADHRDERVCIDHLIQKSFIRRSYEPQEVYRPTVTALAVLSDNQAIDLLDAADAVLRHMKAVYEHDPDNPDNRLSVADIVAAIALPEMQITEAMRYLVDTPATGGRSIDFPNSPESSVIVGEQLLDFGSINNLVAQLAKWANQNAAMHPGGDLTNEHPKDSLSRFDRAIAWTKNHWLVAPILIFCFILMAIVAFMGSVSNFVDLLRRWFS